MYLGVGERIASTKAGVVVLHYTRGHYVKGHHHTGHDTEKTQETQIISILQEEYWTPHISYKQKKKSIGPHDRHHQ